MLKHQRQNNHVVLLCILIFILSIFMTACNNSTNTPTGQNTELKDATQNTDIKEKTDAEESTDTEENTDTEVKTDDVDTTENNVEEPTSIDFEWPEDFSLYTAYEGEFLLGTIYTDDNRSGADQELTLKHFNAITAENIMKPEYMQPTEGSFNYLNSDVMVQFGQENGQNLVGHTLAWHSQSGKWLGRNVTRDQAIEQLKSHITNIVGNYKGEFLSWDVVNEAINDGVSLPADGDWTKCLRVTQWLTSIGPDYMAMAFTFAHEADPDLKLYYNDYNLNDKSKADIVYAMVKDLREQGIPIDGIGMQGHYSVDTPIGSVEYSLKRFAELGVEISITELDVGVNGASPAGLTEEQEIKQGLAYAELFQLFREYSDNIGRVTLWGYVDNKSWRSDRFPCLFNSDYTPKQAAYAVLNPEKYILMNQVEEEVTEAIVAQAKYGTPIIDAEIDAIWNDSSVVEVKGQLTAWEGATGKVRVLWDEKFVYALFEVEDGVLNSSSPNAYEQDSVEIFLDQNNGKTAFYEEDDGQYRVNYDSVASFGSRPEITGFTAKATRSGDGYLVEMAIPLVNLPTEGMKMGFEAQINDSNEMGMRQSIAKFSDMTDYSYQTTEKWAELELVK
ncbi:MAG TPA: endo-1,4-beta-xylanase [Mobilitalea sp.]|nr:endo-1,4-beta-xylanase [Mobilitalea sp.]